MSHFSKSGCPSSSGHPHCSEQFSSHNDLKSSCESLLENPSTANWITEDIFTDPSSFSHSVVENSNLIDENQVLSFTSGSSSISFSDAETEPTDKESQFVWIDQSNEVSSSSSVPACHTSELSLNDVESVRKRLEKRKRRDGAKTTSEKEVSDVKRMKNTIAARRYRQRREKEVEILDKKVRELENELSTAKLEIKWWQMEAQRWRKISEGNNCN